MHAFATTAAPAPSTLVPNVPSAPSLAQGSSTNLTATWTAPAVDTTHSAATGFNLQFSPSGIGAWTIVTGVTSPYTLSGLAAGEAIDVQVQGKNAAGASAWSATSTLSTATLGPYIPNTPNAPVLAQGSGSNLNVTWTAPAIDSTHSAATGFNLRSSPSGAGAWTVVAGATTPYVLSGLAGAAAYDVQVQSANTAGTSAWSTTSTLTTAAVGPFIPNTPAAPLLAQGNGTGLTVTWTTPAVDTTHSAATSFNLRSSPTGAGTWTVVSGVTSPYALSGLTAGAAFDVQVQSANSAGVSAWSATSTLTTATAAVYAPNAPTIASVTPPPDGTTSKLTVTWTAPAVDATHGAATGYNLRSSPSGAGTWTTVTGVTSPYTLTGLAGATAIDFEIQATNAAAVPGAWSAITTGTSWGATVAPAAWVAASTQVHNTSVAPNGGVNMFLVAAPTAVTTGAFGWSTSNTVMPTTGLIAGPSDGQANGYGTWFNAPATAGTYYLWLLAQTGTSPSTTTIGALVTSAITVT